MAGTRKSTRNSLIKVPVYTEATSESEQVPTKKTRTPKSTRQKRVRDVDEDVKDANPPPPKKQAKSPKSASSRPKPAQTSKTNPSNRTPDGQQETFWLLKAEPLPRYENGVNVAFSIDDLQKCTEPEPWTGVRNHQAKNNMLAMREGDLAFFYHSNAKPSGIVGIMKVVKEATVDESAFDPKDPYYDSKSDRENPKWFHVHVGFVRKFDDVVDLHEIKSSAKSGGPLEKMQLVTNSRLSVSRVTREEWDFIIGLAEGKGDEN
ncbi:DUF55-domain-containing protein [Zopfia rhizophila CBS 207.26]|uniref:Thymocyte nuclear protein 1 n=1 Tax=Zopfia rhizophila CBS 207.26 TaxID=1314779 RepID=A0A6A6EKK5_9PEZI|nr:DUF55-domain-containing protein [Zopfia rhizophila CBS 207.26]